MVGISFSLHVRDMRSVLHTHAFNGVPNNNNNNNRFPEQIVHSVPRVMEAVVEVVPPTPQESVQNRVGEQIVDSVPRVMEAVVEVVPPTLQERVQNRPRKLFVDLPVPLITEIMDVVFGLPQERVQNRATYTGKVFTVRHHRDDRACTVD